MKLEGEQTLLRVYLRNTDKYGLWRSAADTLVSRARQQGLAGATVLHGVFGLDAAGQLLESGRWSLVETLAQPRADRRVGRGGGHHDHGGCQVCC